MSKTHKPKNGPQGPVPQDDLIRLVVKPLSGRIDQLWLHLFEKIQGIEASLDIIARGMARQIQNKEQDTPRE
jgi:hypothetical protein